MPCVYVRSGGNFIPVSDDFQYTVIKYAVDVFLHNFETKYKKEIKKIASDPQNPSLEFAIDPVVKTIWEQRKDIYGGIFERLTFRLPDKYEPRPTFAYETQQPSQMKTNDVSNVNNMNTQMNSTPDERPPNPDYMEVFGGNAKRKYNGRLYKIHVGPKGGKYINVKGKKIYV